GRLNGHLEHLTGNQLLQPLHQLAAPMIRLVPVDDEGEGVHRLPVQHDIHLDQLGSTVSDQLVIEGSVTARPGFELVEEIVDDLRQVQLVYEIDAVGVQILHVDILPPFGLVQLHHGPHVIVRHHDGSPDIRLLDVIDLLLGGHVGGIVDLLHFPVGQVYLVNHAGRGGDQRNVEFPLDSLLDDLHVQQAQKTAAKTE